MKIDVYGSEWADLVVKKSNKSDVVKNFLKSTLILMVSLTKAKSLCVWERECMRACVCVLQWKHTLLPVTWQQEMARC